VWPVCGGFSEILIMAAQWPVLSQYPLNWLVVEAEVGEIRVLKPDEPPVPYQFYFGNLSLPANTPFRDTVKPNHILSVNTLLSYYENIFKALRIRGLSCHSSYS